MKKNVNEVKSLLLVGKGQVYQSSISKIKSKGTRSCKWKRLLSKNTLPNPHSPILPNMFSICNHRSVYKQYIEEIIAHPDNGNKQETQNCDHVSYDYVTFFVLWKGLVNLVLLWLVFLSKNNSTTDVFYYLGKPFIKSS